MAQEAIRPIVALFRDEITPAIRRWARKSHCLLVTIQYDAKTERRRFMVKNGTLQEAKKRG